MFSNPQECSMVVDWLMPQDTPNSLIHSYRIDLAKAGASSDKSTWTWYTVSTCGTDSRTTCNLEMMRVINGDYGLSANGNSVFNEGDEVYARTTAIGTCMNDQNQRKESIRPAYDHTPVVLRNGATSIAAPRAESVNDDEIRVCWNSPNADGNYQYNLLWTTNENYLSSTFQRVNIYGQMDPLTNELCYTHRTDPTSSRYFFKVAAENDCGYIESPVEEITCAKVPEQPVCSTQVVDCNMEITWNPVESRGSAVSRYIIEIQDQFGFYRETSSCQNTFNNRCLVSMRELAMDYGLVEGETIYVQIFAENGIGRSVAGRCSACAMKSLPDEVAAPHVITETDNQITIGWTGASNCDSSFDSDCHYEVTVTIDGVSNVYTTPHLTYTEYGVDKGANYCFQVRACNSCGVGQRSEPTCIDQCVMPMTPARPRITEPENTSDIVVRWNYDPTSACYNQQCHYTVTISTNDGRRDQTIDNLWTPEYTLRNKDP